MDDSDIVKVVYQLGSGFGNFSLQIKDYLDEHDGGNNFDPQPLGKEGALLGVDLDKLGLKMLLCQDAQVLVNYLKGEST